MIRVTKNQTGVKYSAFQIAEKAQNNIRTMFKNLTMGERKTAAGLIEKFLQQYK